MGNNIKLSVQFVRQPRYYKDFACIGPECPQNCCFGWGNIDWSKDEFDKLKSAECSDEFKELIDKTFIPGGNRDYIVNYGDNGYCPLQDENGLCRIQKELGVEYMSRTCMMYPRISLYCGNTVFNYCYLSCYHVLDTLCNDKDCMKLETRAVKKGEILDRDKLYIDNKNDLINHPELKYRQQIFDLFYDIISDESYSVETAVILGSPAAEKLTEFISQKLYDRIPELIRAIKPQLKDYIKVIDKLEPNYGYKIQFAVSLCILLLNSVDIFSGIMVDNKVALDKYLEGERRFNEAFADRPFAFRNIALNLLLECRMPFRDKECSIFDNYCYFASAFAVMRAVAPAIYMLEGSEDEREIAFKKIVAYLGRSFSHDDIKVNKIIGFLKDFDCTDHSRIAALIR